MINEKNWVTWTINTCLVIFIIALLYNESSYKDKREIEKVYKAYIQDFIENDFEGIASHFESPVNFVSFGIIAQNKVQVISVYKDIKDNIQNGYSYSTVDSLKISKKNDFYVADVIYSRFNSNDEKLFTGNTLYEFKETDNGWKMISLNGITDFES